jgi:hypothetical protein
MKLLVATFELELIEGYDGSSFVDWDEVPDWAKPYVAAVVEAGIVLGSLEGGELFIHANSSIIREEMIAMAVRALEVDVEGIEADTPDFGNVSDWAVEVIAFAVNHEMINLDAKMYPFQ